MSHYFVVKRSWVIIGGLIAALYLGGCANLKPQDSQSPAASKLEAQDIQGLVLKGDNALRAGDLDRALLEYVKALEFDPENTQVLHRIGTVHALRGDMARAERTFLEVLEKDETHPKTLEALGLLLVHAKRRNEAKAYLEKAITQGSPSWRAYNALGAIYDLSRHYETAQKHYLSADTLKPDSPVILNNLGYSKYLAGDWDAARSYYERVLKIDPSHEKTWLNLGLLYARNKQYVDSLQAFERILDRAQALNNLGFVCMLDGQYEEAEGYFLAAIKESPSYYSIAYDNLARVRKLLTAKKTQQSDSH